MRHNYSMGNDRLPACMTKMTSETTADDELFIRKHCSGCFQENEKNPYCKIWMHSPKVANLLIRQSFSIGRIRRNVPTCACRWPKDSLSLKHVTLFFKINQNVPCLPMSSSLPSQNFLSSSFSCIFILLPHPSYWQTKMTLFLLYNAEACKVSSICFHLSSALFGWFWAHVSITSVSVLNAFFSVS